MDTPFVFGKLVTGKNFTDRENELKHLKQNFISGINTILISPRRWGKSSLVKKAGDEIVRSDKKIKIVYLDMFNMRSEEEFYKSLSENVLKSVSNRIEELIANSKEFFKQFVPKITFSAGSQLEISLGLNWSEVKQQPDEILNLPERISEKKGYKIIICINEFQNLAYFEDPLAFQKKMRSFWQQHQFANYCLYGSKRHMLTEVFTSPSMPFYKFGDLLFLNKIPADFWKVFIRDRFRSTGKKISSEFALAIAFTAKEHPYYVQQLAQLCWLRTTVEVQYKTVTEATDSLVRQLSLLFQYRTESLSTTQIYFLKAMISGVIKYSSKETISDFNLGTSANVARIKSALIRKEIIDEIIPGYIEILDPIYEIWLKDYYFKL
ncbi:MAG: ATPase [Bacteroidales bacterium]|nr:ATPase [Bacteroidales bacterium]